MYKRHSHCSYCGHSYQENQAWPRSCGNCTNTTYLNPVPVSVVLLPVDDGLLMIRRNIEPRKGQLALPGGFINYGESWQTAGARELMEETGVQIDASDIELFNVLSTPDSTVLIFGLAKPITRDQLPELKLSEETSEITVINEMIDLAFPLHTQVARAYFQSKSNK